jgi:hypothetical protein
MRSFSLLRPGVALAILGAGALIIPFAGSGGCSSHTACFTFSQSELAENGHMCPLPQDALSQFSDPNCPGPVVAVNGPGQFDGELCCYPVTFEAVTPACANGGSGGSSSGGGAGGACDVTCAEALMNDESPCSSGAALAAFVTIQECAGCESGSTQGSCGSACQSACGSLTTTPACLQCLQSQCPAPLAECMSE